MPATARPPRSPTRTTVLIAVGPIVGAAVGAVTNVVTAQWNWLLFGLLVVLVSVGAVIAVLATRPAPPDEPETDPDTLLTLLREGFLTPRLPAPLRAGETTGVAIADTGKGIVGSVQLLVDFPEDEPGSRQGVNSYFEVYASPETAAARSAIRLSALRRRYEGFGGTTGDADGFAVSGNGEWICGGHTGPVYVEVSAFPDSNAVLALAVATRDALVRHVRALSKQAAV